MHVQMFDHPSDGFDSSLALRQTPIVRATLSGLKIGPTWGDQNGECTKEFTVNLPFRRRGTFVDALRHACDDGDFVDCLLHPDTVVEVVSVRGSGRKTLVTTRVFRVAEFPSAAPFVYQERT